jgi:hypothetical protein
MSVDSDHVQLDSDRPKPLFEAANTNAPRGVVTLLIPIGLPMISVFSTCESRKNGNRNKSELQPVLEHVVIIIIIIIPTVHTCSHSLHTN